MGRIFEGFQLQYCLKRAQTNLKGVIYSNRSFVGLKKIPVVPVTYCKKLGSEKILNNFSHGFSCQLI